MWVGVRRKVRIKLYGSSGLFVGLRNFRDIFVGKFPHPSATPKERLYREKWQTGFCIVAGDVGRDTPFSGPFTDFTGEVGESYSWEASPPPR